MKVLMAVFSMAGLLASGLWSGAVAADKAPEAGTPEHVFALETGNLPSDVGGSVWKHEPRVIGSIDATEGATWPFDAAMTETGSSPAEVFPTVEIGGHAYRVGVDLGP
jgi:hypothetical protein